jgi:hypothetical protein
LHLGAHSEGHRLINARLSSSSPRRPPSWTMPLDAATATTAAIALVASRRWRLVELGLVDLPYAARAVQESQRHGATDPEEVIRPNLRHAGCLYR